MRAPSSCPLIRKLRLAAGDTPGKYRAAGARAGRREFRDALDALAAALDRLATRDADSSPSAARISPIVARRAEAAADARSRAGRPGCAATDDARRRRGSAGSTSAPQGWQLHASPLSVADVFRRQVDETGARVDLHVGDARGRQRFLALHVAARPRRRGDRLLGQPVRLRDAGAAVRAARPAAAELRRAHRRRRRRRAAGAEGERRARVPAVHDAARAQRGARAAGRGVRARRPRFPRAGAGRRLEDRAACCGFARSATRCCWAARASGKASTCPATRCRSSSSTSCRSRRPTIRCWRRGSRSCAAEGGNPFMD